MTTRALVLLPGLLLLGACRTIEGTIGLPPFIEYRGDTEELFVRPLLSVGPTAVRGLWPIFHHRHDDRGRSVWLLPLMLYRSRPQQGGYDRDLFVLPLTAWGDSPDEGAYFGVFPFGGRFKSFLGMDEFDFALFPLYLRQRDRERVSYHILWPLVNWVSGRGHSGWRVWPFWARYAAETPEGVPKFRRSYVLWPLFSHQESLLDTRTPATTWSFFPFWSHSESKHITRRHILWPLFASEENRLRGYRSWGMSLVPVRFATGEKEVQIDPWPFFGWWDREERFRQYALWPLQRYEREKTAQIDATRFWFLPFWWQADTRWPDGASWTRRKLWPFFSYERQNDAARWDALSLLPWFDATTDDFWGRLWQLARWRRRGDDEALEILWGLVSWESGTCRSAWRLLGGLAGREVDGDVVTTRVLFIPFTSGG